MLGYCKRCSSAVWVENVNAKRTKAEISCLGCGKRKFVDFSLIESICRYKGIKLDRW